MSKEQNTLNPIGLFATPDSVEALQKYVEQFNGPEGVVATTVMGMTWNLCAKLTAPTEGE